MVEMFFGSWVWIMWVLLCRWLWNVSLRLKVICFGEIWVVSNLCREYGSGKVSWGI